MSTCQPFRAALAAFHPAAADLSDEVALHLDTCEACRAAFDARFPPWRPGPARPAWKRWLPAVFASVVTGAAFAAGGLLLPRLLPDTPGLVLVETARPAGDLRGVPWLVGEGSDQYGDLTVVVFWEVWCPHCDDGLLHVESLYDVLGPEGLDVVGVIALSKGSTRREALDYLEAARLTFPHAWDRDRALEARFGNDAWPRAYLVREGLIVWEGHPKELDVANLSALLP